ncbi:SDR family oxidoreductase [bacterium]|nr:SDR family oxidoreductase [bacterium]
MKVVIFGAAGRTGHHLIRVALSRRHQVTAFVRDRSGLLMDYSRLRVVEGDIHDPRALDRAMKGQDAVLCALTAPADAPDGILAKGTARILEAMERHRVRRLVCLSKAGVLGGDSASLLFGFRISFLDRKRFADLRRQARVIRDSGLDWILVRPPRLTDDPLKGRYEISLKRPKHRTITRLDLAIFMVNQLRSKEFVRKMPAVSN